MPTPLFAQMTQTLNAEREIKAELLAALKAIHDDPQSRFSNINYNLMVAAIARAEAK